ncbi:unnamed protein product [Parascedosporium putredinis]|uniref:Uncharacterized protein n=1 Tax=Parascedosporium putredinis TaxID=1442378 RepID=A0A9P1H1U9_9PEZI|nr:unnamed protein product [Parascedosporium putredinis]CAI7993086.1 unnamed protein product [Parascedosporium putredinis]
MKLGYVLAIFAIGGASAAEMRACSKTSMNGSCKVATGMGKTTGTFKSYNWRSSANRCVRVCNGCKSYSNNNISFNKFIVFDWDNGEGPESSTCC